ncbi:MAG: hypothetical protein AAGJ86_12150 [Pseudomonadota bacterium]
MSSDPAQDMFLLTAILPNGAAKSVAERAVVTQNLTAFSWRARTTLLRSNWLTRWMPPVTPMRTIFQMVVPARALNNTLASVARYGRLDKQATGAVFAVRCERSLMGPRFSGWPKVQNAYDIDIDNITQPLTAIFCVVGSGLSDQVARAAVAAGAHGPIVSLAEGRGLRDRIGWLRITKEHTQDVQLVLAETGVATAVFNAMARAGQFEKPGRGLIYQMPVAKGLFNLASEYTSARHAANMQQIIDAIDNLAGHTHWRDRAGFDHGEDYEATRQFKVDGLSAEPANLCLTALVRQSQSQILNDLVIDCGASGLNSTHAHFVSAAEDEHVGDARIHDEYALIRSVVSQEVATRFVDVMDAHAGELGLDDYCVATHPISAFIAYKAGSKDYRSAA